jgi:hypothetical protein
MRGESRRQVSEESVEPLWKEIIYVTPSNRQCSFAWAPSDAENASIHNFTKSDVVPSSCNGYL